MTRAPCLARRNRAGLPVRRRDRREAGESPFHRAAAVARDRPGDVDSEDQRPDVLPWGVVAVSRPGTMKAFGHAITTGTPYEIVHRLRRRDGEYRWHQARGDPVRDRDGVSLLTSMTPRRLKSGCAAAKPIWRKHRG
jgi:PAS domain-containing protein